MLAITRASEVGERWSTWLAKLSLTCRISYFMSLIQLKIHGKLGLIVEIEKNKQTHVLSIISSKAL